MALPPTTSAGKSLRVSMPCSKASWTSPGVATPGIRGMPLLWLALARDSCKPGLMAKTAPASSTALSCSGLVTVPAPTMALGTSLAIRRMASRPTGVRRVISRVGMPPSTRAWDKSTAVLKSSIAITGTTAPAVRISRGVSLDILGLRWGLYRNRVVNMVSDDLIVLRGRLKRV